ncbi:hypothetical protein Y1Q_0011008 [Alligator mississippiensis]|uniref:Immunoglobulin-like beta-sandwich domain-containing protein n=1 Tax=Alligator mississippiensis TaxID=8496 RepID=A0A151LY88_ALLMI|nr:hypothetical protein Y1Q_0011008 [Alligator mississippiensis]
MVVIPIREITLGADMTIQCQTHHRNVRFFLYKDGYPTLWQPIQPAGVVAVFLIHCVRQDDGGNYICVYHRILEPGIRSYPSDPMELLVRVFCREGEKRRGWGFRPQSKNHSLDPPTPPRTRKLKDGQAENWQHMLS